MSDRIGARELFDLICEPGSFVTWDEPLVPWARSDDYETELASARERSGVDESVLTGEGLVGGHRVALVASEFAFLGGSIGRDAAGRLIAAIERATAERLPLLAGPASGGTRIQEGTAAFVAMAGISAAIARHKAAGLPYLVYLRHPTTGGVMSSWGSLGHVTVAEPGALLGFLGPRAAEAITGSRMPADVQTAENLYGRGLIDAIVPPRTLPRIVRLALDVLMAGAPPRTPEPAAPELTPVPAPLAVTRSRDPKRPGLRALLDVAASDVLTLNGTGRGEADHGLLLALAKFGDAACVVVGHDRPEGKPGRAFGPAALRQLQRGVRLSRDLGLPLVSIVDTPGAELTAAAEEGGLPGEIARSLADLMQLSSPTVSVILGQGTGGGALASLPADRVLCARNGWLAPLPPEGAAAIIWRDPSRAEEMAESLGMTATDLLAAGIVDAVIPEFEDAAEESTAFCRRTGDAIAHAVGELAAMPQDARIAERVGRYR